MVVVCQWHPLAWRIAALRRIMALSMHVDYADCKSLKNAGNIEARWVCSPALGGLSAVTRSPT